MERARHNPERGQLESSLAKLSLWMDRLLVDPEAVGISAGSYEIATEDKPTGTRKLLTVKSPEAHLEVSRFDGKPDPTDPLPREYIGRRILAEYNDRGRQVGDRAEVHFSGSKLLNAAHKDLYRSERQSGESIEDLQVFEETLQMACDSLGMTAHEEY